MSISKFLYKLVWYPSCDVNLVWRRRCIRKLRWCGRL